jgi:hypothetical protein
VLIHDDVTRAFRKRRSPTNGGIADSGRYYARLVYVDEDGRAFLNYLQSCRLNREDGETPLSALRLHRDQVVAKLSQHKREARVRAKYGWVAHYHNRFCGTDVDADIDRAPLLVPWPERSEGCREPRP